jgi:hypothetical protein
MNFGDRWPELASSCLNKDGEQSILVRDDRAALRRPFGGSRYAADSRWRCVHRNHAYGAGFSVHRAGRRPRAGVCHHFSPGGCLPATVACSASRGNLQPIPPRRPGAGRVIGRLPIGLSLPRSIRFNGAALFRARRSLLGHLREAPRSNFNGAAQTFTSCSERAHDGQRCVLNHCTHLVFVKCFGLDVENRPEIKSWLCAKGPIFTTIELGYVQRRHNKAFARGGV